MSNHRKGPETDKPFNSHLSPSQVAKENKFADVPNPGLQTLPDVQMSEACDKPHIAQENINMVSGYSRVCIKRGEIINDRYLISILLKDGAKIAAVDELCTACGQKLPLIPEL